MSSNHSSGSCPVTALHLGLTLRPHVVLRWLPIAEDCQSVQGSNPARNGFFLPATPELNNIAHQELITWVRLGWNDTLPCAHIWMKHCHQRDSVLSDGRITASTSGIQRRAHLQVKGQKQGWKEFPKENSVSWPRRRTWILGRWREQIHCCCSVTNLCLTLWDPMDYSLLGSSVHGTSQARVLKWVANYSFRGVFPNQGSNPWLLHRQADSLSLSHVGSLSNYKLKWYSGDRFIGHIWQQLPQGITFGVGGWRMRQSGCLLWITEHHTLLRNLNAGQEATVRTGHGTTDWFQTRKGIYCHPAYLTYIQSTSYEIPGWRKHNLESRLPEEISITSDMQKIPPLWQKVKN